MLIVLRYRMLRKTRGRIPLGLCKTHVVGKEFAKESSLILDKIFTLSSDLVLYKFGELKPEIYEELLKKITKYLNELK